MRKRLRYALTMGLCFVWLSASAQQMVAPKERPNVLLLVADDMNWDTPGCFGGAAEGVTPNLDLLASEGMQFWHAYVNISICTPSRSVILSGLYPQNNGAEGFQRIHSHIPTLPAILSKAGYVTGIVGKPLRQQELFRWSVTYRWQGVGDENLWGRDPAVYRKFAKSFFEMAKASQQPFFLMASSHDPHSPFAGDKVTEPFVERDKASRTFGPKEVRVPGFLPDLPPIRQRLADYTTSARRLDDMVGVVLDELSKAQLGEETMVVFLSDHGMDFASAKFNCYVDSVRTPLIVRWPGKIAPGSTDRAHMVAAIDLQPTILEAVGLPPIHSDGRSFLPLLQGKSQANRDAVFAQFHHIHGEDALPMRSVLTKESAFVFNPWSNGEREFKRLDKISLRAMQEFAITDPEMARRVQHLTFRSVEEFYDLRTDPHSLHNLLGSAKPTDFQQKQIDELRARLRAWMVEMKDPALHAFDNRDKAAALEQFVQAYRQRAAAEVEALKPYEAAQDFRF